MAWPLAVTAGFGAYKQKKLPPLIFNVIEKAILTGGHQIVLNGSGSVVKDSMIVCPNCKTQNDADSKFCVNCGNMLKIDCPDCGFELAPGSKFCPNCGKKL